MLGDVFQKVHNSPLKITWFCSRTPRACTVVIPLGFAINSFKVTIQDVLIQCVKITGFPTRTLTLGSQTCLSGLVHSDLES